MAIPSRTFILISNLVILLLSACVSGSAPTNQPALQDELIVSSSLSNQTVESIAQDSAGFVWIGTYRGLNRYDGYEMHQYFCNDQTNSLPDDQVWKVFVDHKGIVWIGTKNGVARYTSHDDFEPVRLPAGHPFVYNFVENSRGDLFALTPSSVLLYSSDSCAFYPMINQLVPSHFSSMTCYMDAGDNLWIVDSHRALRFNSYSLQLLDTLSYEDLTVNASYLSGDHLWLASRSEIRLYDIKHNQWEDVPDVLTSDARLMESGIQCIYEEPNVGLYIGTMKGLFFYDSAFKILLYQNDAAFPFEAPPSNITSIYSDNESRLWICSSSQGFVVRTPVHRRFNADNFLCNTLSGKPMSGIAYSQGTLWLATQDYGLYKYSTSTHKLTQFDIAQLIPNSHEGGLRIFAMTCDHTGDLWLSVTQYGVLRLHPDGDELRFVSSYPMNFCIVIKEDVRQNIWVGTYNNLFYSKRPEDTHFQEHRLFSNTFIYLSCFQSLHDGRFAALTKDAALRYVDLDRMELGPQVIPDSLLQTCIKRSTFLPTCLLEDREGRLWMGTVSNGLLCYESDKQTLTNVLGAPCPNICGIEEDQDGNLWVSTMYGIGKYDIHARTFYNYFESDGIGGNQFVDRCSCQLPDGTIIFGGVHGITMFNPQQVAEEPSTKLYFEDLKINNRLVRPGKDAAIKEGMPFARRIDLNHRQQTFSISFCALDFSEENPFRYQYMLEGFNKDWVNAGDVREAFYDNLKSGSYLFRVRVTGKDQNRVISEISIPLYVHPAWWFSWWAWLIYIAIITAVGYNTWRMWQRIRHEKRNRLLSEREKEHERRINQMNMNFFANVSHEFRAPLTIINGPVSQLAKDPSLSKEHHTLLAIVQRSVDRMLRLVNQMMDFHKLEDDALCLEVQKQDIIALIRPTIDTFQLRCREKGLQLSTHGLEDTCNTWVDGDKLEKIIYNLLGNATKYTPSGGKIDVSFDVIERDQALVLFPSLSQVDSAQFVELKVADTGEGIPESQLQKIFERYYQINRQNKGEFNWGTGIGLYYTKRLVEMHHGAIKAQNRVEGTGSIFIVLLPIGDAAYPLKERISADAQSTRYPIAPQVEAPAMTNVEEEADPTAIDTLPNILVIDDDVEIVHYIKTLLSPRYNVICRFDAESGLEAIDEKAPELILCDVMMQGMDGYEFCRQVKNDLQICHIPVILVTAKTTGSDQVAGLDAGADAYVTKPFDPIYLLALISSVLQNREKTRHLLSESTQTQSIEENTLSPQDNAFITEIYSIMEKELGNPDLDINLLTDMLHISRTKLYYKVKGLTGETPSTFFKRYKLNRAAELIREGRHNISEISDMTGYNSLSHFSASFKKQFGVTPSEYK